MKEINKFLFIIFLPIIGISQTIKEYKQKNFESVRTDSGVYDFWLDADEYDFYRNGDTIPYFIDIKDYKGITNYGIRYPSNDRDKNYAFIENFTMYNTTVKIDSCFFNTVNNTIKIYGRVKSNRVWRKNKNLVKVFIGAKQDTIGYVHTKHLYNKQRSYMTYNGERVESDIIVDSFPGFYIKEAGRFITTKENSEEFVIEAKIEQQSILAFGLGSSFSEIFNIGKMVFSDEKTKINDKKNHRYSKPLEIIKINKQMLVPFVDNTPNYYKIIEKAEDFILKKQYGAARNEYNTFLENKHYVFARDIHNAVRVAILSRDYKTAIIWSEKLVAKGVGLTYFEAPIFNRIEKQPEWQDFINGFDDLHSTFLKTQDTVLIRKLNAIVDLDQKYYVGRRKGEYSHEDAVAITEINDVNLIQLIDEHGFPTEEKIGVFVKNDYIIDTNPRYRVLLYHSYQTNSPSWMQLKNIIETAYSKFEYDSFRDGFNNIIALGGNCFAIYKGNLYVEKGCFLDNLKKLQKQIRFQFNNPYHFIMSTNDFAVFPYEVHNDEANNKFMKDHYNFVEQLTDDWLWYEK
ncbi:hypothetical protein ACW5R3_13495 [Bizionia sp. KMM 8389]